MSDIWCDICSSIKWGSSHECPPLWEYTEEDPREGGEFYGQNRARDAERAADMWAIENFGGEWRETAHEVWVRQLGTSTVTKFSVRVELVPSATSSEVESFELSDDDPECGDDKDSPDEDESKE